MKNILFTLALLVSFSSFGQNILDTENIHKTYPNMIYGIHDENGVMAHEDGYLGPDHLTEMRYKAIPFESDFVELEYEIESVDKDGNEKLSHLREITFRKYVPNKNGPRQLGISFYRNGDIKSVIYY